MASATTYQAWRRSTGSLPLTLRKVTETLPSDLQPGDVLVRIHAVSLNYRDVAILHGKYPVSILEQGVPASDCAAEVVRTGSAVTDFKVGDKVAPIFDLDNLDGTEKTTRALGGDVDGVLREYAVFDQKYLYSLPRHLSWEEACTITCAGVTAWNALNLPGARDSGKVALLQGTGGVSFFGLIICLYAGIRPIITSSSEAKLDAILNLSLNGKEIDTINYKTHPRWEKEVQRLTDGQGADIVLENVGITTMEQSLASIGRRGSISLIGFLGGLDVDHYPDTILPLLMKSATLRGIAVGSKIQHQELSQFLEERDVPLKAVLDKEFSFDESVAAFDYLYSGGHSGKVIIKL